MNKTVSINLGGLFFHIDEDAYQKLNRYFDAIKRSLSPDGKEEIMSDIEGRIAELLSEKLKNDKQVVGSREVDEVIAVMGQPEDYRIDEETAKQSSQTYYTPGYDPIRTKKFYRDGDRNMIAGVCAGIAHYFRIDPLWIRIIFIISLFLSFGTSIIVYVLLWILIPKAITTTEKLEMTGEPINISNIEKKVREEINSVSERLQNVDYGKIGAQARTGAERVGSNVGSAFSSLFRALAKVIGAIITVFSAVTLGGMVIGFIVLCFWSAMPDTAWDPELLMLNFTDAPMWLLGLLGLFATGIPVFFIFLLGLKILVDNLKPVGNITKYTLLAIWIVSVAILIFLGVRQASQFSAESKSTSKREIQLAQNDTLYIKFRHNDYFTKSVDHHTSLRFTQDSLENDVLYSNNISFHILETEQAMPYVQIEKHAHGISMPEARKRAENIKYNFEIQGNKLILDNYFLTDISNKFRDQEVEIYLYLPEGTIIKPDVSVQNYNESEHAIFDMYDDSGDYVYKMEKHEVKCLNCPTDEESAIEEYLEQNEEAIKYNTEGDRIDINVNGIDVDVKIKDRDSLRAKVR
jgi:phage shock protein PspC (stress-responsive transcriptional regulator)